jgi:hypothetical protein
MQYIQSSVCIFFPISLFWNILRHQKYILQLETRFYEKCQQTRGRKLILFGSQMWPFQSEQGSDSLARKILYFDNC